MNQTYTIIIEQGQDGFLIASVLEIPGCRTQARSHDQLLERTREAIDLYKEEIPKPSHSRFLGIQQLQVHA